MSNGWQAAQLWLLAPLSGAATHEIAPWAYWHARLMVAAWAVALPLGVLAARYGKVRWWQSSGQRSWQEGPRRLDDKTWWRAHLGLQWAGAAALCLGLVLAWGRGQAGSDVARAHAGLGWAVSIAAALQVASGLARGSKGGPTDRQLRGDHFDMTPRRVAFERLHKGLGHAAVLAAIVVISLGLVTADAPRWMAVVLAGWWLLLGALAVWLQCRGRCIDTYQAIWGNDPALPGNRREPIGWGVRRLPPHADAR